MNAITTKVVRTNNNPVITGEHMTITRIVNDPDNERVFGFAISDEKEEIYIPARVIQNANMTEDDAGAGFTAPIVDNPRYTAEGSSPRYLCQLPVHWDGEQTVEIEVLNELPDSSESTVDIEVEYAELAQRFDDFCAQVYAELDAVHADVKSLRIMSIPERLSTLQSLCDAERKHIDEVAPENESS